MGEQQSLLTEESFITPLKKVLNAPLATQPSTQKTTPSIKESLDTLFPEQKYQEKRIQKAKELLGSLTNEFTEPRLSDAVIEIQCLAESWLDDFERQIFKGVTLHELLHEKGGA